MTDNLESYRKAGKIAGEALKYGSGLIKPGVKIIDVLDKIEDKIRELGGDIAFPAQVSLNHIAAHYCADPEEETVFKEQVACLDIGVHIDGYIGDTATTVDLSGKYEKLVAASRKALNNAIAFIKPGVTLGEIGKTIQETITAEGFSPIRNLSGHGLGQYQVHTKPSIPNFDSGDNQVVEKDMVFAIEPFATDGTGLIAETSSANIFSFVQKKPVRSLFAREILKEIQKWNGLPFTTRWLTKKFPAVKVNFALKELLQHRVIRGYAPLAEVKKRHCQPG